MLVISSYAYFAFPYARLKYYKIVSFCSEVNFWEEKNSLQVSLKFHMQKFNEY